MFKKNWLIIPFLIIGFYYNSWTIQNADIEMVFQEFIYCGLILIFLIFLGISLKKDLKKNKNAKTWKNFIPTIIGFAFLFSFFFTNLTLIMRDNSPIVIQAGYDGGYNGAWLEFRKDGTYKFVNSGRIGAITFRGKYEMQDSLIIIDKSNIDNVIKTNTLAIRNENYAESKSKIIYQIDKNHKIIDKNFYFIVNEYKINE